jgi:hypothetical protein
MGTCTFVANGALCCFKLALMTLMMLERKGEWTEIGQETELPLKVYSHVTIFMWFGLVTLFAY